MYDEIIEDIASVENIMTPTSEIYQKISSHYLGELLIPFSTIYASQRVSFNKSYLETRYLLISVEISFKKNLPIKRKFV